MKFPYDLFDRGKIDKRRYDKRLRDIIKSRLPAIISKENIITGKRGKKVKISVDLLEVWQFKYGKNGKSVGMGGGNLTPGDYITQGEWIPGLPGQEPAGQVYEQEFTLSELIDIMLEDLNLPNLDDKKHAVNESESYELQARARHGGMHFIDKRQTFKEFLKRLVAQHKINQRVENQVITNEDMRFKSFIPRNKEILSAIIFFLLDASGSMDYETLYLVKAFFFYLNEFLKRKYDFVEREFLSHDTEAYIEPDEESFFKRAGAGGTCSSSVFLKTKELIDEKFPPSYWNIYLFYFSDGENFEGDMPLAVKAVKDILPQVNFIGYGEIRTDNSYYTGPLLSKFLKELGSEKLKIVTVRGKTDVYDALQIFLKEV